MERRHSALQRQGGGRQGGRLRAGASGRGDGCGLAPYGLAPRHALSPRPPSRLYTSPRRRRPAARTSQATTVASRRGTPMLESRDRILTTHVGSLPRNATLTDLLIRREAGEAIPVAAMAAEMDRAVNSVVEAQLAAGIDVGNDGEQQRVGFQTYRPTRMAGFGGGSPRKAGNGLQEGPELID